MKTRKMELIIVDMETLKVGDNLLYIDETGGITACKIKEVGITFFKKVPYADIFTLSGVTSRVLLKNVTFYSIYDSDVKK